MYGNLCRTINDHFMQVFVKESTHKEIDFGETCIKNFHLGRYIPSEIRLEI